MITIKKAAKELGISSKNLHQYLWIRSREVGITLIKSDHTSLNYEDMIMPTAVFDEITRVRDYFQSLEIELCEIEKQKGYSKSFDGPCIYFLFDEDRLVYIGQTVNFDSRIKTHMNQKYFTHTFCQKCCQHDLTLLEAYYISTIKTSLNKHVITKDTFIKMIIDRMDMYDFAYE